MKKIRVFTTLIAVIALIAGILLIGNAAPSITGCCFMIVAAASFFNAYLSIKTKPKR